MSEPRPTVRHIGDAVLDAALDAVAVLDASGGVLQLNPAAVTMFGILQEQAVGRPLPDLIMPERTRGTYDMAVRQVFDGTISGCRVEACGLHADGRLSISPTLSRSGPSSRWWFARSCRPT